jgi:hypothetical protein
MQVPFPNSGRLQASHVDPFEPNLVHQGSAFLAGSRAERQSVNHRSCFIRNLAFEGADAIYLVPAIPWVFQKHRDVVIRIARASPRAREL